MSRINDLDKTLDYVRCFSNDLAYIENHDLSINTKIDIALLVEYLEELKSRGFINYGLNGSYITLKGRMALENAKNGKPFQEELENRRIKRIWSIVKIVAAVFNAIAIIIIAIWSQLNSNKQSEFENEISRLKESQKYEQVKYSKQIDSLETIILNVSNAQINEDNARK